MQEEDVDILVNAAGVSYGSLLAQTSDARISRMLETNLQGTIFACKAFTRQLLRRRQRQRQRQRQQQQQQGPQVANQPACIINISSLQAIKPGVGAATYAATKAGVVALTRAIVAEAAASTPSDGGAVAERAAPMLRANALLPGWVRTDLLNGEQFVNVFFFF